MTVDECDSGPGLIGCGYEGREIGEFVQALVADGVDRLVDVRLMPLSRKRGFSKTALREALADAGIVYEHCRELGNPKDNRAGFGGSAAELANARAAFGAMLTSPAAQESIRRTAAAAEHERVALLCFEADQGRCHRDVVIEHIRSVFVAV